MGHSKDVSDKFYAHVNDDDLKTTIESLARTQKCTRQRAQWTRTEIATETEPCGLPSNAMSCDPGGPLEYPRHDSNVMQILRGKPQFRKDAL